MKSLHAFLFSAILLIPICGASPVPGHPRLLVSGKDWKELPSRMKAEPAVAEVIATCISRADAMLEQENLTYKLTGRRMLSVSRDAIERILDLSTAWKVTNDRKYLERCRSELLGLSALKDWHPSHHLDTAEMQTAVAIGYDWLYADLSPEDRKTISTALLEKGLKETFAEKRVRRRDNNWNQVCNGGMVLSAVALLDVAPDLARSAIAEARESIPRGMKGGYPAEGAYAEGAGYWGYGTVFSILTAEALRTAGLPEAGIVSHPGFLESGQYEALVFGNTGLMFNYGDNKASKRRASAAIAWMAKETRSATIWDTFKPTFLELDPQHADRFLVLAAFWMPNADTLEADKIPLHYQSAGKSPIAIHRTGLGKDDLFLGIKAGKAEVNHGHMDAGSFVLDFLGERWASDLGSQDYNSLEQTGMDLFDQTQDSLRWTVFRLNNLSHNTLSYNGRLHRVSGAAEIVSSKGAPENETIVDMTAPLGLPEGAKAERRFRVTEDPATVTITDTISGLKPGDTIEWNMLTPATPEPSENGFSLSLGGRSLMLSLTSAQEQSRSGKPADPPPADFDEGNPGVSRIVLSAKAGADGEIGISAVFGKVP
jgi:hypothetical protein